MKIEYERGFDRVRLVFESEPELGLGDRAKVDKLVDEIAKALGRIDGTFADIVKPAKPRWTIVRSKAPTFALDLAVDIVTRLAKEAWATRLEIIPPEGGDL